MQNLLRCTVNGQWIMKVSHKLNAMQSRFLYFQSGTQSKILNCNKKSFLYKVVFLYLSNVRPMSAFVSVILQRNMANVASSRLWFFNINTMHGRKGARNPQNHFEHTQIWKLYVDCSLVTRSAKPKLTEDLWVFQVIQKFYGLWSNELN